MNFDYSDEQKMLKEEARRFLGARCDTAVVRGVLDDDDRHHDDALWRAIAAQGWLGAAIPEAYGGLGLGHVELCALAEELGRALAPVPFASTVYFVAEALMLLGSEEQKTRWLPRIAAGRRVDRHRPWRDARLGLVPRCEGIARSGRQAIDQQRDR